MAFVPPSPDSVEIEGGFVPPSPDDVESFVPPNPSSVEPDISSGPDSGGIASLSQFQKPKKSLFDEYLDKLDAEKQNVVIGTEQEYKQREAEFEQAKSDYMGQPEKIEPFEKRYLEAAQKANIVPTSEPTVFQSATEPLVSISGLLPEVTPEQTASALGVSEKTGAVISGISKGVVSTLDFLATPLGIATLGTSELPAVAQKAVSGIFAAQMASQLPDISARLSVAIDQGNTEEAAKLTTEAATTLGFTALAAKHALSKTPTVETLENKDAPLTAQALKEAERNAPEGKLSELGSSKLDEGTELKAEEEHQEPTTIGQDTAEVERQVNPNEEVQAQKEEGVLNQSEPASAEAPDLIGMGGAVEGEFPKQTEFGELIPAREGVPAVLKHPDTATKAVSSGLGEFFNDIRGELSAWAGKTLPKTTIKAKEAGEAGARYISSKIAAPFKARLFTRDVLAGLDIDPDKFGAALSEDNLRSVKEQNLRLADEAETDEQRAKYESMADNTYSFVGENKPFKTEQEYQDFLNKPEVKEAINRHIDNWNAVVEPMYKQAMSIDPDVELPSRGIQTGARVNLRSVQEGEALPDDVISSSRQGNLLNTLKKKSPFGVRAKGTGEHYLSNYSDLMANTFYRQLEIANKNAFDKTLVDKGLAVIDKPGQKIELGGEKTVAFPIKRKTIVSNGESIPANEAIYVKKSIADEYRTAANVDAQTKIPLVSAVGHVLNHAALAGLTDATVHITNLTTALAQLPINEAGPLADAFFSAAGRLDVPIAISKAIKKGTPEAYKHFTESGKFIPKILKAITPDKVAQSLEDSFWKNQTQLAELSEIGALREQHAPSGLPGLRAMSQVIQWYDKTVRMVLDDAYNDLASKGTVENSETARREFINQVGQYNKRAQGWIVRKARETELAPFITAGRQYNVNAVRQMLMDPGVKATSREASLTLKAAMISKWLGTFAFVGLANYLLTGSMTGRTGTPLGSIDSGQNDEQGRMKSFSVVNLTGQGRAMRVTGMRGLVEGEMKGLPKNVALDSAERDIINSWISPFAGPSVRFGFVAATGSPPAKDVGRVSEVVPPGGNQGLENLKAAVSEANPLIASALDTGKPGSTWEQSVERQLPRFMMQTKQPEKMMKDYPAIVRRAQANAFMEDVIHRARRIENEQDRRDYIRQSLSKLNPADRPHAELTLRFRRIQY